MELQGWARELPRPALVLLHVTLSSQNGAPFLFDFMESTFY